MNLKQSFVYLDSFLNYERLTTTIKHRSWNLDRMKHLLRLFNSPEKNYFSILIAGTKGKGSTGHFLESILKENSHSVGFYCSPHLETPLERIRIGGKQVSSRVWCRQLEIIKATLSRKGFPSELGEPTYFEIMTLLAAMIFRELHVKVAIFEIGMGGRFDAANAIDSPLAILTPIHYDHEKFLGNTLQAIAGEKVGIIRNNADVITAPQLPEAQKVIEQESKREEARLHEAQPVTNSLGLEGDHQLVNAGVAQVAADVLAKRYGFQMKANRLRKALNQNGWHGRLETLKNEGEWLLDVAHNPASIEALVRYLNKNYYKDGILIFNSSQDKKVDAMMELLSPFFSKVIIAGIDNPRMYNVAELMVMAQHHFESVYPAQSVEEALRLARLISTSKEKTVITGSFYLVGEARGLLKKKVHYAGV